MVSCDQYNVVFYGDLAPGKNREQVQNSLTLHFHIGAHQFEHLFTHTPLLLKREVNYTTALKHQIFLEWIGLLCRIEPMTHTSEQALRRPPEYCNVVFTGELRQGHTVDDVKCNLMAFLHLTKKRIDDLFVGHPVTLMRDVDSHPALKMQVSFELAGAAQTRQLRASQRGTHFWPPTRRNRCHESNVKEKRRCPMSCSSIHTLIRMPPRPCSFIPRG